MDSVEGPTGKDQLCVRLAVPALPRTNFTLSACKVATTGARGQLVLGSTRGH